MLNEALRIRYLEVKPQSLRAPEVEQFDQIAGTHMGADAEV